jgi:hypothetical protein
MIITYCNIKMEVEYCYEEAEPQTYDYPGSPDSAVIESVYVNEVDIYDMLTVEQLYDIEGIILDKIRN